MFISFKAEQIQQQCGLCVSGFERSFTSTYTVASEDTDGAVAYSSCVYRRPWKCWNCRDKWFWKCDDKSTAPTVTISSSTASSGGISNDTSLALTFTLREPSSNFDNAGVNLSSGSGGVIAGTMPGFTEVSSTVYTTTWTPENLDSTVVISYDDNYFMDAAGNIGSGTNSIYVDDETTLPSMTITSSTVSSGGSSNDSSIALTFTSSEATTNFAEADITVSGGSLSNFSATSSTVYTATFTPSGDGDTTIDVGAGSFTDAYGNNNTAASQFTWSYDGTSLTMTITSSTVSSGDTSNDSSIALTFTSSETTTNFAEADITVSGGSLRNSRQRAPWFIPRHSLHLEMVRQRLM